MVQYRKKDNIIRYMLLLSALALRKVYNIRQRINHDTESVVRVLFEAHARKEVISASL